MSRRISAEEALDALKANLTDTASYCRMLEKRLADLVHGEGELPACEVDSEHSCPDCGNRTLVKVPLRETGQPREGVPGHVANPTGYTGIYRYVCQYDQMQGILIGPCGWAGWQSDLKGGGG